VLETSEGGQGSRIQALASFFSSLMKREGAWGREWSVSPTRGVRRLRGGGVIEWVGRRC